MKHRTKKLPSWKEVRAGLILATKIRLLAILGRIYLSKSTPRSVKLRIVQTAKLGVRSVGRKVRRKSRKKRAKSRKMRTPAQRKATKKLIAFNKRRR
jgi:hypothetical protein